MELLLIFAPVLAGLLFTTLNDDDDDGGEAVTEPEVDPAPLPEPEPQPEPGTNIVSGYVNLLGSENDDVTISNPEFYGLIHGGEGNDTLHITNSVGDQFGIDFESAGLTSASVYSGYLELMLSPESEYYLEPEIPNDPLSYSHLLYYPEQYSEAEGVSERELSAYKASLALEDDFAAGEYPIAFLTELQGGGGDDQISLADGYFYVDGGQGADTVEIADGAAGHIVAGEGDSILITSAQSDMTIDGIRDETFLFDASGSDAGTAFNVTAYGASTLIGGAGDDELRSYNDGAMISGGEGDDYIGVTESIDRFPSQQIYFDDHASMGSAQADAGPGDDIIIYSFGDSVTGGEGRDHFTGYLGGDAAVVTDFNPSEDSATIWVNSDFEDEYIGPDDLDTYFEHTNGISAAEVDGNTEISEDGIVIARFEGVTGMSIAIAVADGDDHYRAVFVDQNGDSIDPDTADIVIREFVEVYT